MAELAKSKLESEGIHCFLADKNLIGIQWLYSFALGGVKVQVKDEDFEKAINILNEDRTSALLEISEDFPAIEKNDLCVKCNSSNITVIQASRKAGALSLLLGFPFIFFRKRYKCNDCGFIMKP